MKKKALNYILVFLILFSASNSWAQNLFAYHITGKVYYSDLLTKNTQVFYNYKTLPSTVFKLEDKAELILRDNDYNLLIIKSKGSYAASDLIALYNKRGEKENFAKTTIDFLSAELVRSDEDIQEYAESYLKQAGGVSRGNCLGAIMTSPLNGQILDNAVLSFTWEESPSKPIYEFQITDGSSDLNNEKILFYTQVEDATELAVRMDSLTFLKDNQSYAWSVNPIKEPNCARFNFKITSKEELKELKDSLIQSIDTSQSITDQLVELANLYETNGLIEDAIACYELAYTMTEKPVFLTLSKLTIARHH